jgi:hypothetical protein
MATQQGQQMSAAQINSLARMAIQQRSVRMLQQIQSTTVVPANQPTVTIIPRNVGLINGFWVKVVATVSNGSAVQIDLSNFGPANVLSQIQFNDLANNTRIQTTGWHLNLINSWKNRRAFASALTGIDGTSGTTFASQSSGQQLANTALAAGDVPGQDSPISYGSNWTAISAPGTIAASGTGVVTMWYYVPLAYNPDNTQSPDLRGAVYANVLTATMQLFLSFAGTFGTSVAAANGTDSTSAMYVGDTAGSVALVTLSTATITVYQDYFDQLPVGNQGVLLPITDLATIYELKYTNATAISTGQDYPYQYANYRSFLSTIAVYVNNGTTGARGVGGDINYWALQSANFTNIWKVEPSLIAIQSRQHIGLDQPPGVYFFDSRNRPISTTQYGNMQLILNAATASNNPYMLVAVEDFALVQTLSMAGSLAAS